MISLSFYLEYIMSTWTHVNSSIRFDSLRGYMDPPDLGVTAGVWDDYAKATVPCGSEGSLDTYLWVNPHESCMAAYTGAIFGDLRSYEDVDEIVAYFNRIVEGQMIRQGFFTIEVSNLEEPIHYTWVHKDGEENGQWAKM